MNSLVDFFNNFDMKISPISFNKLFYNDKDNFYKIKDIILNNINYKVFLLNILYESNINVLFNLLSRDEVNSFLSDSFDLTYATKHPSIVSRLYFIPDCLKDKIFKFSYYGNMNIDDCLYIFDKKVHDKNDLLEVCTVLLNFDISVIKKILDNDLISFNFSFEEIFTKIKERKSGFVRNYLDLSNIHKIKSFSDNKKFNILLDLNYDFDFINNKDFVDCIVSIGDVRVYRKLMYKLEDRIDINYIDKARRKYIRSNINNVSEDDLTNYIIDYLFGDFYRNVIIDIGEMINYKYSSIIDKNHIKFYKMILDFNKFSKDKKLEIFNKFKFLDIKSMFYDDISKVKLDSYSDLMDNNFVLENKNLDKRLSRKYNIPVYKLNGEKFFMLVRCNRSHYSIDEVNCKGDSDGYSFSFISDENISTFTNPNFCVCCLYDSVDPRYIVHVSHTDSYSEYDRVKNKYASHFVNEIKDNKTLMDDTVWYNEIVIDKNANLCAKAMIVLDEIYNTTLDDAKRLGLPILLINSRKYGKREYHGSSGKDRYLRGV